MKRGQVAVEYMMILGIAFAIMVPGGYLFYTFSQGNQDTLISSQITRGGSEILNRVNEMFAVGQNSWTTVEINFPDNVRNVYLSAPKELVIEYETQVGVSEAVFFSNIDMTTPYGGNVSQDFKPGMTRIKVTSLGSEVEIREVT